VVRPQCEHDTRCRLELVVLCLCLESVPEQEVRARRLCVDPDGLAARRLRVGGPRLRQERRTVRGLRRIAVRYAASAPV